MYDSWAGGKVTEDSNSACPACQSLPHSEPAALIYRFRATRGLWKGLQEKKKKWWGFHRIYSQSLLISLMDSAFHSLDQHCLQRPRASAWENF